VTQKTQGPGNTKADGREPVNRSSSADCGRMRSGAVTPPIIRAMLADITTLAIDVVVNAANGALVAGGGVDGAIHAAAGEADLAAACAALGGCEPGDAKATPGFGLPARWIVHTVGPIWRGGRYREAEVLASCYRRSVEVAGELGARSMAIPAISTGAFGYPEDQAAEIAVATLRSVSTGVERIVLVAFDPYTRRRYEHELNR
jgi:O-acetyl-ADP-ribose deacetylase